MLTRIKFANKSTSKSYFWVRVINVRATGIAESNTVIDKEVEVSPKRRAKT